MAEQWRVAGEKKIWRARVAATRQHIKAPDEWRNGETRATLSENAAL